jgi:hypothetical protein
MQLIALLLSNRASVCHVLLRGCTPRRYRAMPLLPFAGAKAATAGLLLEVMSTSLL